MFGKYNFSTCFLLSILSLVIWHIMVSMKKTFKQMVWSMSRKIKNSINKTIIITTALELRCYTHF